MILKLIKGDVYKILFPHFYLIVYITEKYICERFEYKKLFKHVQLYL